MNELIIATSKLVSNVALMTESVGRIVDSNNKRAVYLYKLEKKIKDSEELLDKDRKMKFVKMDFIEKNGRELIESKKSTHSQKIESFKFAIDELTKIIITK